MPETLGLLASDELMFTEVKDNKLLKIIFCLHCPLTLQSILKAEITPLIIPHINCMAKSILFEDSGFEFFDKIKFECNFISSQSNKNVPSKI